MGKDVLVVIKGAGTEIDARQIPINCRLEGGCVQLLDQFNPLLLWVVLWVLSLMLAPLPDLRPLLMSTLQGELTALLRISANTDINLLAATSRREASSANKGLAATFAIALDGFNNQKQRVSTGDPLTFVRRFQGTDL